MTATVRPFLGVERSFTGRRWEACDGNERLGRALAQRHNLSEIVARIMAARGISCEAAPMFLKPALREQLPDPAHLRDMDRAVSRLVAAVKRGETIGLFGDYDVDGATSVALLARFFAAVGARAEIYVPDRLREGYGPNLPALHALKKRGADVIVTVDCGTTAFDPLREAANAGIDVIVVDHHVAEPVLPDAVAVLNPNRLDEDSPHGQLAAVGVGFLLAVAVNRGLREAGWYRRRPEPDLIRWLDLVALGTVCDVVPLTGINRVFVAQGLKVMAQRGNAGISALVDVAGLEEAPNAFHVGYILGPRINAGGRVGEAELGARLLLTQDPGEARAIAERLDAYNRERRAIEAECLEQAIACIEREGVDDRLLYVAGKGWHPGVIGIVAGRLKERFQRPACVVALREDGTGKGSGRSLIGIDLGSAILAARQSGLLIDGGGHRMAVGFTVAVSSQDRLRAFLAEHIGRQAGPGGIVPRLRIDGAVQPAAATIEMAAELACLAPFGAGNPEPRFALPGVRILRADVVGNEHVRCLLAGEDGGRLSAIAFRSAGEPHGSALLGSAGASFHVAGHLRLDRWQGQERVQLVIEDVAPAE